MAVLTEINDTKTQQLLNDPNMRRAFPFLATAYAKMNGAKKSCQTCGRKKRTNTADLADVRKSLATMSVENKVKLKEMLGAQQVSVKYNNGKGKNIKLRF